MNKRLAVLMLMILLLAIGMMLPQYIEIRSDGVVKQHDIWPRESPEAVGMDANGDFSTHLPLFIVKNNGQQILGEQSRIKEDIYCDYAIIDNPDGVNRSCDEPVHSGRIAISVRGNSSRAFAKKQYAIKLVDENNLSVKESLLGMPAESTWVLNGSFLDRSQIRNYLLYNVSGEIMGYAPRCRLVELLMTDADGKMVYRGLYTLIEKIKVSDMRLKLTEYDPDYPETSYLVQMNAYIGDIEIPHLRSDDIRLLYRTELVYPDSKEVTVASVDYINKDILTFEKTLYDAYKTGDWSRAESLVDMQSFVDYYIINEFFQNYDAGRRSTYLYKNLGGKISIGPVWDFDGTFNNFANQPMPVNMLSVKTTLYYHYLTQSTAFVEKLEERYAYLRKSVLSEEYLLTQIQDTVSYLGASVQRNCDKWYRGDYEQVYGDIEAMKKYVVERGNWMDENFIPQSTLIGREAF